MSFKENLKTELEFRGILIKELAAKSGISRRTLDNYLRNNESQPTAENAVNIAKALDVSVEYLVTGTNSSIQNSSALTSEEIHLYKKYAGLIKILETTTDEEKNIYFNFTDKLKQEIKTL